MKPEELLLIQVELEKIKTRREGMTAENQVRVIRNQTPSYWEDSFCILESEIEVLIKKLQGAI